MNIVETHKFQRYRFVDVSDIDQLESYFSQGFILFERPVYHPIHQTFYQSLVKYESSMMRQPLHLTPKEKACLYYLQTKMQCTYKRLEEYLSCSGSNVKKILRSLRQKVGVQKTSDIVKRLHLYEIQ